MIDNQNSVTIGKVPLNKEEVGKLVKITPSIVRLSGNSSRSVNYSIKDPKNNYYLCAETLASPQYKLQICALWRGGSS